ncbi:hypothetical protein [Actinoplanes solisilvae]|uniref:hypothetical protein n=1 Tax=Actinoplanes solisilvae TaxID=2486853 RepID=UPI001F0BC416|nr:hypothetical protein [Actinoplanes solisilvae]
MASSGSGSGPAADEHLLALLRAIRLRQAAPDAVASGIADTVEALRRPEEAAHQALPPGETHEALPPGRTPPSLPALPSHHDDDVRAGQQLRPRWASSTPEQIGAVTPVELPGGSGGTPGSGARSGSPPGTDVPLADSPGSVARPADSPGSVAQPADPPGSLARPAGKPGLGPSALAGGDSADRPESGSFGHSGSVETGAEGSGGTAAPGRSFWEHSRARPVPPAFKRGPARSGPDKFGGGEGAPASGPVTGGEGGSVAGSEGVGRAASSSGARRPAWTPLIDPTRASGRELPAETVTPESGSDDLGELLDSASVDHPESPTLDDGYEHGLSGHEGVLERDSRARWTGGGSAPVGDDVEPAPPGSGPFFARERRRGSAYPSTGSGSEARETSGREPAITDGEALTPDEVGRYADVEAVGKPSRNRFAGLGGKRGESGVRPVVEPSLMEGTEVETGPRPEWALGSGARADRVRNEGGSLRGESGAHATRAGAPAPRLPGFDMPHVMPPMVARARSAAGDGMDPADDALLRETQRLLSTSLTFAGGPVEVAERLRSALMQAHPSLMEALPGGPRTRTGQLARALTWLVHHLDRPPALVEGTGKLGMALAACGVEPAQLQLVGAALAEAMRAGMAPGQWRQDFDLAWRSTWQHAYEWIAHGMARAAHEPLVWDATVVEHDLRRPDLAVVRLQPTLPMPFRPGQFARVRVAELPQIWRPYSLAGAPRRDDLIELHVRAKTITGVSGTLVHRTKVGDHVALAPAEGAMALPADPGRNLLMIAGDTGVAPLKALLAELADTGDERSAVLFWGVRDLGELYDIEEIAELARLARRATVVPVVSEGDPGPYASGLVTDAVAAYGEWSDHEVYLAGPPLMLAVTSAALHQLGVAPERIHHDPPE